MNNTTGNRFGANSPQEETGTGITKIVHKNSLGITVILTLVALRVGIGMHFFREGTNKLRDPKPFSGAFFGNAKGPMADMYRGIVWDRDGRARLDRKGTLDAWDQYRAQVERHYGFDDKQKKLAESVQKRSEDQLDEHFDTNESDLVEYRGNLARRDRYRADRQRMETPSLRGQVDTIEGDLKKGYAKVVAPIDLIWQGYAYSLNALATPDQQRRGALELSKPGRRLLDSEGIDRLIPWFDTAIGVLLIIGLATRPAALVGAGFLLSVMASQWPTVPGAVLTWPQFIEFLGLLVVAATGAGKYAGLDGIGCRYCCTKKCRTSFIQGTQP